MTASGEHRLGIGASAPATPPTNYVSLYALSDRKLYLKDDSGTISPVALGGVVGPANTVYLTSTGVDGSAARGDASKPFGTYKAALQACQDGDMLKIGPGIFTLTGAADVPAWPAGLHRLVIDAAGCDVTGTSGTVLQNTGNDGSHIIAPPSHVTSLVIRNLRATVTLGTGRALYCDGAGSGGNYLGGGLNGGLRLSNCAFFNGAGLISARIKDAGVLVVENVHFEVGGTSIIELMSIGYSAFRDCQFGKINFSYDTTDVDRPGFNAESGFFGCGWTNDVVLTGGGNGFKMLFVGCDMRGIRGSGLTDQLSIKHYGGAVESYDFSGNPLADVAGNKIDISGVRVNTSLKFKMQGAAANAIAVTVRQCDVMNIGAANIIADNGITIDLRGSNYLVDGSQIVTSGSGKAHVNRILRTYTTDGTTPDVVTPDQAGVITFHGSPDYTMATPKGGIGVGLVSASPTSPTSVTIDYGGGVGDIVLESVWK